MKYDVVIVGAGPSGYFAAYELTKLNKDIKVLLIEKGLNINKRNCPLISHKLDKCPQSKDKKIGCYPACSITSGFGGAGAYSDGKFNITNEFGGWLSDYLDKDELLDLIHYVDSINLKFGATTSITDPTTEKVAEIERNAMAVSLKLLRSKVRHLGTEENFNILKRFFEYLNPLIETRFSSTVTDLIVEDNTIKGVKINDESIYADNVILAVGRDASSWLNSVFDKYNIKTTNNQVDVGVRVETSNVVMSEINKHLYEGKFEYLTSVGTKVRTFCANPSGYVVVENSSGIVNVNGHSYSNAKYGSQNTNFALLVSHYFEEPFSRPNDFAIEINQIANKISCGSVIVQRYGDLLKGRRTTEKRLKEGFITPTLKEAIPGDLSLVLPYKTLQSIIEMMTALNKVCPGIASEHTLFYGVESKFYSARPDITNHFESKQIKQLYFAGDGAGLTRGLAQAGACGVAIARYILGDN